MSTETCIKNAATQSLINQAACKFAMIFIINNTDTGFAEPLKYKPETEKDLFKPETFAASVVEFFVTSGYKKTGLALRKTRFGGAPTLPIIKENINEFEARAYLNQCPFYSKLTTDEDKLEVISLTQKLILEFRDAINDFECHIIALDVETTGLSSWDWRAQRFGAQYHRVLSVAMRYLNKDLEVIGEPLQLVIHHSKVELDELLDDYVRNMHTKSGLLDAVEKSTLSVEEATDKIVDWMKSYNIPRNNPRNNVYVQVLGNSVYTDMMFLSRWHGFAFNGVSYQLIDISAFQSLNRASGRPVLTPIKEYRHEALSDVDESIEEARYYQRALLASAKVEEE